MSTFLIKRRDTRPAITTYLKVDGAAYDLTTASVVLFVKKTDSSVVQRAMTVLDAVAGKVEYVFVDADWDPNNVNGYFIASPKKGTKDHTMEIETKKGSARLTFPNDGYDTLHIVDDIGQQ